MKYKHRLIHKQTIAEILYYDQPQLNEGMIDALTGALGSVKDSVVKNIKESIAKKILGVLGLDLKSTVGQAMVNWFGNLDIDQLAKMVSGDEQCSTIVESLASALVEVMIEKAPEAVGMDPEGTFAKLTTNTLSKAMADGVNTKIAEALCDIDWKEILKEIPGIGTILDMVD